jgi:hypothetical protein
MAHERFVLVVLEFALEEIAPKDSSEFFHKQFEGHDPSLRITQNQSSFGYSFASRPGDRFVSGRQKRGIVLVPVGRQFCFRSGYIFASGTGGSILRFSALLPLTLSNC